MAQCTSLRQCKEGLELIRVGVNELRRILERDCAP